MHRAIVRALPVYLLAALGCSSSTLPGEDTLLVQPASLVAIPDTDLSLSFENHSSAEVGVGELACTSMLQRLTPSGWIDADEPRACVDLLHLVPAGAQFTFTRRMPAISGTFRLEVTATWGSGEPRSAVRVHSPGIEVFWPPDLHGDLAAVVTIREVVPSGDLAVQFENRSDRQVAVGELSCVTEFERKTATGWQRISSLRMCIELLRLVDGGTSFSYVTPAPETPGTYRVIFRAFPTGASGAVDVRSREFEVTAP